MNQIRPPTLVKKNAKKKLKPFLGHFQKYPKLCADMSWLLVLTNGIKRCSSFKNSVILMAKMSKKSARDV